MTASLDMVRAAQRKRRKSVTVRINNNVKRLVVLPSHERPTTRADCVGDGFNAVRPCPFVGCKYHLYLGVGPSGNLTFYWPDVEPGQLAQTCALDVATQAGDTNKGAGRPIKLHKKLVEVARCANVTKQAISHMEQRAFRALQRSKHAQLEAAE